MEASLRKYADLSNRLSQAEAELKQFTERDNEAALKVSGLFACDVFGVSQRICWQPTLE